MAVEFREDRAEAGPVITGFRGGQFVVDGIVREGALLLTPTSLHPWTDAALPIVDLCAIAARMPECAAPEMLILGTGALLIRPAPDAVAALEEQGIGLEVVDSRTAARLWNVLRAEGRDVIAAMLPVNAA